jgi:hypothetical protein
VKPEGGGKEIETSFQNAKTFRFLVHPSI